MPKVAIMTDTNSGISLEEAENLSIFNISMPFLINGKEYSEGIDLTHEKFYRLLSEGAEVSTSQPSPSLVIDEWEKLLNNGYDEVVYIPMSSGLSHSCSTAIGFAKEFEGKVFVVDNKRISVTQRQSVLDAKKLADQGNSGIEIKNILEEQSMLASIYITVDTLSYLKKGGRITPAAAAIGSVLNIKPVLKIQGDKLDALAKIRGMKAARQNMITAMKKDFDEKFKNLINQGKFQLCISYSYVDDVTLSSWLEEVMKAFPNMEIVSNSLSLSIGCHIGPGALAIAACIKE